MPFAAAHVHGVGFGDGSRRPFPLAHAQLASITLGLALPYQDAVGQQYIGLLIDLAPCQQRLQGFQDLCLQGVVRVGVLHQQPGGGEAITAYRRHVGQATMGDDDAPHLGEVGGIHLRHALHLRR